MILKQYISGVEAAFDYKFKHTDKNEVGYFPVNLTEEVKAFFAAKLTELSLHLAERAEGMKLEGFNDRHEYNTALHDFAQSIRNEITDI